MKKLIMAIVCLMTMMMGFTSCGNIESDAISNMKNYMSNVAKNPKSLEITNINTIFKSDSCVVLTFTASGQNGFGGYSKSKYAYLYSVYKFNKVGVKKFHSIMEIDGDNEMELMLWENLKNEINTKPIDSVKIRVTALNIIAGKDIETDESLLSTLN